MAKHTYATSPPNLTGMPPGVPYIIGNEAAERFGGIGPVDDIIAFIRADSTRAICQPKGPNGG